MILHLHEFAYAGGGARYHVLKQVFRDQEVLSPDLPVEPYETVEFILEQMDRAQCPCLSVGLSLGGFYAFYLAAVRGVPAVLINPALRPWKTLRRAVGRFRNFATGETFLWTEEHLEQLRSLGEEVDRAKVDPRLLRVYLAADDELLDHHRTIPWLPPGAAIQWYDAAGHRFAPFRKVAPEFRKHFDLIHDRPQAD
ncbi:MAG: hypothetical protein C4524_00395 [Candidatus Zixiibacteriota bacterium]|nr:MAG: hypothetical protein C4524_00395 [candidate division Zixibacteria bacterium]